MIKAEDFPIPYIESMKQLLGEDFPAYMETLDKKPSFALRVNTLKVSNEELFDLIQKRLRPVPWVDTGFYTDEDKSFTKSPYYYAGLYYMQEASAMTPASLCNAKPGDKVLDLCAAPGGKSTQVACKLKGEGFLVSNDLSNSRAKALLKNIEMAGIGNIFITCEEPSKLAVAYPDFFDHIIVDAPCSGEGMFRRDPAVLQAYKSRGPEFFAPIQKNILDEAAKMLKAGGEIIYSTCTYSVVEDEYTLLAFLEKHPEFSISPIVPNHGFVESDILQGCVRLFPHKLEGEGHFVARLKKDGEKQENTDRRYKKAVKLPSEVKDFLKQTNIAWKEENFFINREYIYYLPDDGVVNPSIRYIRTGLLVGRLAYHKFEPSQAFAMSLKMEDWKNPINLNFNDDRVVRYLRGETIDLEDEGKGYRLVCVDTHPLGFIKQDRNRGKNKYYPGWRMNA